MNLVLGTTIMLPKTSTISLPTTGELPLFVCKVLCFVNYYVRLKIDTFL